LSVEACASYEKKRNACDQIENNAKIDKWIDGSEKCRSRIVIVNTDRAINKIKDVVRRYLKVVQIENVLNEINVLDIAANSWRGGVAD